MKAIGFFLILFIAFCAADAAAQTKKRKKIIAKSSKITKTKPVKKFPKTISAGVINGRAIDLIKPEFPKAALAVNAYGTVQVQILIDEKGDVISAKAVSGHPLLHSACVRAAWQSKFIPMTLSGEFVRVIGVIIYHFIPNEWNWLEIGYAIIRNSSYYTIEHILKTLPLGFTEEAQLLRQLSEENEHYDEALETIIASTRAKLSNNKKAAWLFEIGIVLAKINRSCCRVDEEIENLVKQIGILLQTKPENVSTALVSQLERVALLVENPSLNTYEPNEGSQIYILLKNLEENFPFWGR